MKLAILTPGFLPVPAVDGGAVEVLITHLLDSNEEYGNLEIDVYTIASEKLDYISYNKTEIIQVKISPYMWFYCKLRNLFLKILKSRKRFEPFNEALIKNYLRKDYDLILIENTMKIFEDIYYKTDYKDNLIYHMHNDIDGTTKPEYLCKLIGSKAKLVLTVSEYIKQRFLDISPNANIRVFENCIDLEEFNFNTIKELDKNKFSHIKKTDDIIIMYSGRITPEKGVKELIIAFKKIQDIKNLKLMIVGSSWFNLKSKDKYYEELERLSQEIKERIIFTGYVYPKDMPQVYSVADILVIPSLWEEPFGVVALEGMAMKLPLIISDSGGLIDIVNEKCALVIERKEDFINQLSEAIKYLSKDSSLRNSMGNASYQRLIFNSKYNKDFYYKYFIKYLSENFYISEEKRNV